MKPLTLIAAVLVLVVGGTVGFAYSGLFDVSATAVDPGVVRWLLETTRENAVRRRAGDIDVPDLTNETQVAAGARAFGDMCAGCHGAPGQDPFLGAQDMNPPPPDLAESAAELTAAELFWVVKHGIRMTGMPAWGRTHSDRQLWELVAFIERLQTLSADDFRQLVARSSDSDGHGHEHAGAAQMQPAGGEHGEHTH